MAFAAVEYGGNRGALRTLHVKTGGRTVIKRCPQEYIAPVPAQKRGGFVLTFVVMVVAVICSLVPPGGCVCGCDGSVDPVLG